MARESWVFGQNLEREKVEFSAMNLENLERERVGISAMDLYRERERELTFS